MGNSIRLKFRPDPKYQPTSNEAKVFHSMEGVLLVDAKQARLAIISSIHRTNSPIDSQPILDPKITRGGLGDSFRGHSLVDGRNRAS